MMSQDLTYWKRAIFEKFSLHENFVSASIKKLNNEKSIQIGLKKRDQSLESKIRNFSLTPVFFIIRKPPKSQEIHLNQPFINDDDID